MTWNVRIFISPPFQCTSITNRVLSLFDCFTTYYNCMTWNVRKLISPPFHCTSITNRVFRLISPFNGLLQHYDLKFSENSYFRHFSAQVSQIVFLAYLTVLRLFTTVWPTENVRKLLFPPFQCTSITKRFVSLFDRFTTYYNCMTWNVRKLISPPFQCTNITNRVFRLFLPLKAYYNFMT